MQRRIIGIETEYGIACMGPGGQQILTPEETARYLFKPVVQWGRSSNIFIGNGSRLYLDVGSHPEFATAECDSWRQSVAYDRSGERIFANLARQAQELMAADGVAGKVFLFKNNTDSAGNAYGCHENYLLQRSGEFARIPEILLPFLITRQIVVGAGKIHPDDQGGHFTFSQRADHMWDAVSSATTRARPMINTRDEPHADAELYRRLHVIVGDSNMAEPSMLLKVALTDLVLQAIEAGVNFPKLTFENPISAIRDINRDMACTATYPLKNGEHKGALEIQRIYQERVQGYLATLTEQQPDVDYVMDLWERTLCALESGDYSTVDTELDWAIKLKMFRQYQQKNGSALADPRLLRLELAYHDIDLERSVYGILVRRGAIKTLLDEAEIAQAVATAPPTTRAHLRGQFVKAAHRAGMDYTVDWVHLKVNDMPQRTVVCKDPFDADLSKAQQLVRDLQAMPVRATVLDEPWI